MKTPRTAKLPPFYTQSIGAFPRARAVVDLLARRDEFTPERFSQIMNDLVRFAIRTQGLAGLDVVSDGEWRRPPNIEFLRRAGGFAPGRKLQSSGPAIIDVVVKRMSPTGSIFKAHADFLVANTARHTKFILPGPFSMAIRYWHAEYSLEAYPSFQLFMDHLVQILFVEVHALVAAGIDIIQIDEPALSYFSDPRLAPSDDPDDALFRRDWAALCARAVAALNRIAEPAIGKAEIHLHCAHRDYNPRASALADYKPLFVHLLNARIDRINLAFAGQGAASLEGLALLPAHIDVGIGALDVRAHSGQSNEDIQSLARTAAKFLPATRIALNPDCSFPLDPPESTVDDAYDKLARLTAAAKTLRANIL